jgi:hypothetical protein
MSARDRPRHSHPIQTTSAGRTGTSASIAVKGKKKQQFENTVNGAIMAATVARSAVDTISVLSPLNGLLDSLITMLESVKVGPSNFHMESVAQP